MIIEAITRAIAKRYLVRRAQLSVGHLPQTRIIAFDIIGLKILIDGRFENRYLHALRTDVFPHLPSHGICLDIGGNIGNHALFFADHFEQVHAFEPNKEVHDVLTLNARLKPNIVAHPFGLSSREAELEAAIDPLNIGGGSIAGQEGSMSARFKVKRLDDVALPDGKPVSFIKIDIEGHELDALKGAEATISTHKPVIVLEARSCDVENGTTPALSFLRGLGYRHMYRFARDISLSRHRADIRVSGVPAALLPPFHERKKLVPLPELAVKNYPMVIVSTTELPCP